jgi:hypothetical protein
MLTPHANCTDVSGLTVELVGKLVLEELAANMGEAVKTEKATAAKSWTSKGDLFIAD